MQLCKDRMCDYYAVYGEFKYQAAKLEKRKTSYCKNINLTRQLTFKYMFVVTNMKILLEDVIQIYCNRGTMKNFIKGGKKSFNYNNMSCCDCIENANKLQIAILVYNFNNWL
jgi:hypothetical protein